MTAGYTALFHFPTDADLTRLLLWLGDDYPQELAATLERGFDRQQPGTHLVALECLQRPELLTHVTAAGTVTQVDAHFQVRALLADPWGGFVWLTVQADLSGQVLDQGDQAHVDSDVQVLGYEPLQPAGQALLDGLQRGIWCERRQQWLEWGALLEELLVLAGPQAETSGETWYLAWPEESILDGLVGEIGASFPPDRAELTYITLSPLEYAITGPLVDGLLPEWQHLTRLFGPHTHLLPNQGFRWDLGQIDILLLTRSCNEFHYAEDYHKWLAIHWLGE